MQSELFEFKDNNIPLSEVLRPDTLDGFVGQKDLIGEGTLLRKMVDSDDYSSFILWGPPGSGKTTIANIISKNTNNLWRSFSAVISGIKEIKEIMEDAKSNLKTRGKKSIIFIDEIHRFNKAQQDAFLPYVENGTIILIGATTENPSFSIISPLLSRMRVFVLKQLKDDEIAVLIEKGIKVYKERFGIDVVIDQDNLLKIVKISSGDVRRALGIFEMAVRLSNNSGKSTIDYDVIKKVMQGRVPSYDKKGEYHFDYISALHKSLRNSDVDASIYYAVKMLESGEDPLYIIRRVIRFASEDIGLADSNALAISINAKDAITSLGMPEASLAILQAVVYCALAPKSNSLYEAYNLAKKDVIDYPDLEVPYNIRNAPTKLMKSIGYGDGYQYAHDNEIPITSMQCLPDKIKDKKYYTPKDIGFEKILKERVKKINDIKNSLDPS